MRRFGKIVLFGLACLATLLFVAYQFENLRGWRAWKKYKAQVESRGENLDPASVIPPRVPDASNFAVIPYFLERFDTNKYPSDGYRESKGPLSEFREALDAADNHQASVSNSFLLTRVDFHELLAALRKSHAGSTVVHDAEAMASQRRYGAEMASTNKSPAVDTNTPAVDVARELLLELQRFDPVIKQIEDAAPRPLSRYPVDYEKQPPFTLLLPHLAAIRTPALLLKVRAMARLQAGQGDLAIRDIYLMWRLADSIQGEPTIISFLVRIAMLNQSFEPLAAGLSSGLWTDTQIAQIQTRLQEINLVREQLNAMHAETVYFGLNGIDYLRRFSGGTQDVFEGFPSALTKALPDGWFYLEMINYHRMSGLINEACNLEEKTVNPQIALKVEKEINGQYKGPEIQSLILDHNLFTRLLLPALTKLSIRTAKTQAGIDLATVACALERYRLAHDSYPEKLDDLGPLLKPGIHDVIQGKPLHYFREPLAGYVVYSVGWNEKDEQGFVEKKKKGQGESMEGDWAWRPFVSVRAGQQ